MGSKSTQLSEGLEPLKTATNYKFSATKIGDLGATEYTIATIVQDVSDSVGSYSVELENCVKAILKACQKSPRADNLMFRLSTFNHGLTEVHGFKELNGKKDASGVVVGGCQEADYNGSIQCSGSTALFDAVHEAIECSKAYGKQLVSNEFQANAIIFVVTDGQNNTGNIQSAAPIKKALEAVRKTECLESIAVVLIGVTQGDVMLDTYLKQFVDEAGLTQYVDLGKASPQKIAKLAQFVSQSISSTSSALGTGQKSKPVSFSF